VWCSFWGTDWILKYYLDELRLQRDYFLKQHWPVDLCNGEVWCSLWGTDWILKYYLDELRLQRDYFLKQRLFPLNNINQLISVMVKCDVLFKLRTEFLNEMYTSFVFKGLILKYVDWEGTKSRAAEKRNILYWDSEWYRETAFCVHTADGQWPNEPGPTVSKSSFSFSPLASWDFRNVPWMLLGFKPG
jgi:hypothetical protein